MVASANINDRWGTSNFQITLLACGNMMVYTPSKTFTCVPVDSAWQLCTNRYYVEAEISENNIDATLIIYIDGKLYLNAELVKQPPYIMDRATIANNLCIHDTRSNEYTGKETDNLVELCFDPLIRVTCECYNCVTGKDTLAYQLADFWEDNDYGY